MYSEFADVSEYVPFFVSFVSVMELTLPKHRSQIQINVQLRMVWPVVLVDFF